LGGKTTEKPTKSGGRKLQTEETVEQLIPIRDDARLIRCPVDNYPFPVGSDNQDRQPE
jgi:hypothetical protein